MTGKRTVLRKRRECSVCGVTFWASASQKCCSVKCRHARSKEFQRKKATEIVQQMSGVTYNCFTMSASSQTGTIGEVMFDVWATKRGYYVARLVVGNSARVDRVIWDGERWRGVQVKTSRNASGNWRMRHEDSIDPVVSPLLAIVNPDNGDVTIYDADCVLLNKDRT